MFSWQVSQCHLIVGDWKAAVSVELSLPAYPQHGFKSNVKLVLLKAPDPSSAQWSFPPDLHEHV